MKDIYVLRHKPELGGEILAAADDYDRVSMEMAKFRAFDQDNMEVVNIDLLEDGD